MAEHTKIEWTDATWNPVTGCSVVSPGCTNCYAMKLAGTRLKHHPTRKGLTRDTKAGPVWNGQVRFNERQLIEPLGWKKPKMIFVCAHGDLFHESVPNAWIDRVFAVMALCPHHTFQVLTKRPERMRAYLSGQPELTQWIWAKALAAGSCRFTQHQIEAHLLPETTPEHRALYHAAAPIWPLPNVWLGTSVEDQRRADERIPHLLNTPAAIRFLSAEPLLGPVDLTALQAAKEASVYGFPVVDGLRGIYSLEAKAHPHPREDDSTGLNWVIVGGESGPGARPMHPYWARSLRDQCQAAGVAFFFKQWGNWTPGENVNRTRGTVRSATWWNDQWSYGSENLARHDGHIDDEPDLYELTKKAAGRLLDGIKHSAMPERR